MTVQALATHLALIAGQGGRGEWPVVVYQSDDAAKYTKFEVIVDIHEEEIVIECVE